MPEAGAGADGGLLGGETAREFWGRVGPEAPLPAEGADLPVAVT